MLPPRSLQSDLRVNCMRPSMSHRTGTSSGSRCGALGSRTDFHHSCTVALTLAIRLGSCFPGATGAAFGLHVGPYSRWVFFVIAAVAVVVLFRMSRSAPAGDWFRQLALGLVTGGAAGNLIECGQQAAGEGAGQAFQDLIPAVHGPEQRDAVEALQFQ